MKKLLIYFCVLAVFPVSIMRVSAQNKASFELGSGLNFSLNDGDYQFKIGGMIQPSVRLEAIDGAKPDYYFNVKRSFFNISGKAINEKISFLLQTDFSLGSPLLDAWVAYMPIKGMSIAIGQKQNSANNREMLLMEDKFQFADRSMVSTAFSASGREFGLFVSHRFSLGSVGFEPQGALTSGDGRNSFGVDSRDYDRGGLKYGGRLDIYPLGFFAEGNGDLIADLAHEESLKVALGAAASYNDGVSNSVGEGHGEFQFYDKESNAKYPDYRKFYADLLLKYKGFSLLGEYVSSSATALKGSFINAAGTIPLQPTQISEFLALGSAFNTQLGYVSKSGYAIDLRYDAIMPEFDKNVNSIIQDKTGITLGLTKYFKQNNLKIQGTFSYLDFGAEMESLAGSLIVQLVF